MFGRAAPITTHYSMNLGKVVVDDCVMRPKLLAIGVIVEPGRPEGPLVISDVQANSVHLAWKPPSEDGGGNILGYLIEAKDVLHMDIHKTYIWSDGPQTEFLVKDLQTSHIYQFRVYAQNEAGRGEALLNKNVIRIKAATKKPPSPSKPTAAVEDDESVLVQWTLPEGFADVNYIIERCESKSDLWMQCNHEFVTRTSYLITGLMPGKEYKFRVTSESAHGVSQPSEESDTVQIKECEVEPPNVTVPVTDCFVKVEDSAFFSCEYSGTQPILVNWSKDGIRVREGFGASIKTEITKSSITLEDIESDDDECSVQCDLRNTAGKALSKAKIKILSPPKLSCPSSYKDGLTYDAGDQCRIKVSFSGKPAPRIKWLFNNKQYVLDDRVRTSVQSEFIEVQICELKHTDTGNYEFVAENEMGKDCLVIPVTITGPPDSPPGFPSLKVVSEDEALLKWNIPVYDGGSYVFNYIIEIKKPKENEWEQFSTVHDPFLQINSATLQDKSVFRIRAENIYGTSEPSKECQFCTKVIGDDENSQFLLGVCESKKKNIDLHRQMTVGVCRTSDIDECFSAKIEDVKSGESGERKTLDQLLDANNKRDIDEINVESINDDTQNNRNDEIIAINTEKPKYDSQLLLAAKSEYGANDNISSNIGDICSSEDSEQLLSYENKSRKFTDFESIEKREHNILEIIEGFKESESFSDIDILNGNTATELVSTNLKQAVSVVELHECELISPLEVMYVEVQISTSTPILNFACVDVYDFDEVTHFAADIIQLEEYLIQSIDHILCYTVCCFTTALEISLPLKSIKPINVCNDIHYHDYHLKNYDPIFNGYSAIDEYSLFTMKAKAYRKLYLLNSVQVTEVVHLSAFHFIPLNENSAISMVHYNINEAACISITPNVFESLLPFVVDTLFKHTLTLAYEPYNSVIIFETVPLHSSLVIEMKNDIKRAISITHISREFETLAGLKCVPMTSYKPALSVLPMSRTAECYRDQRSKKLIKTDSFQETKKKSLFYDAVSQTLDEKDDVLNNSYLCVKCGVTTECLCRSEEQEAEQYLADRSNVMLNSMVFTLMNGTSEKQRERDLVSDVVEFSVNIPGWLRFVSPLIVSNSDIVEENVTESDDNSVLSKEQVAETEISKSGLKDRSVQELLDLAEQVEKSFSQKTEHFESLETILHEELSSLEKDLEAVHKIHQTFWNESEVSWLDSSSLVGQSSSTWDESKIAEKDLIDFKKDVPLTEAHEMKETQQGEYAPQVITHLQNRVVQCGCRTRLYCSISGYPDPHIAWLKNGKLLRQSSRYVISNLVEFGLYVDIFNAKSSDSGEYMCIATNCHGSAQSQAYVSVVGHREYSPEEPKFLKSPNDITVKEGESVVLEWKVTGTPVPHVMWFRNAERIQTSLRIDTFSNHRGCCRLVLHNVTIEDGAIYTCYLENEAGSSISTVQVTVADDQQTHCQKPDEMDSTYGNLLLPQTEDSNIPSLQYYEKLLSQESYPSVSEILVKLARTEPQKRAKKLPGPPFAPKILNSGKTWAILSWLSPVDRLEKNNNLMYLLERRALDGSRWKEVARTRYTLYTVSGLKKGRSYIFRISAGTRDGWGPPVTLMQPVHCTKDPRKTTNYEDQIAYDL